MLLFKKIVKELSLGDRLEGLEGIIEAFLGENVNHVDIIGKST